MDLNKLMENKMLLAIVGGSIVLLLIIFIICGSVAASKSNKTETEVSNEPMKEDVDRKGS